MKRFGIILLGASMLLAQPVAGQTILPPLTDGTYLDYIFKSGTAYGNPVGQLANSNWAYVGPYLGEATSPFQQEFTLYCVDQANYIRRGDSYSALINNLGDSDITGTRMATDGVADAYAKYQKAAYLASLYFTAPVLSFKASEWVGIQHAIWYFTSGLSAYDNAGSTGYISDANTAFAAGFGGYGFDRSAWSVLTIYNFDDSGAPILASKQEMLAQTQSVVPEPQTYVLMGTGLIFLVFFGRRRMKEMGYV